MPFEIRGGWIRRIVLASRACMAKVVSFDGFFASPTTETNECNSKVMDAASYDCLLLGADCCVWRIKVAIIAPA